MHLLYITFSKKDEALEMAAELIKTKLVACANLYEGVTSIYEWEGQICQTQEYTLICKTSDKLVASAMAAIKQKHSYECPCIIAVAVDKVDEKFRQWVDREDK